MKKLLNCHDCGAKPGQPHMPGCDTERCSVCGGQALVSDCKGHDPLFARWTGIWPGKAEADYLGLDLNEFSALGYDELFFVKPGGGPMRTLNTDSYTVNYNGDFSGDVILRHKESGSSFTIPFNVLEELVAEKVRADRIGALEEATAEELLS